MFLLCQGLCEIKCPESVKDKKPSSSKVLYLIEEDDCVTLDKKVSLPFAVENSVTFLCLDK
jgi:hypothetical protein